MKLAVSIGIGLVVVFVFTLMAASGYVARDNERIQRMVRERDCEEDGGKF